MSPIDENSRFNGSLRHYHRVGGQPHRTWEEWVGDKPGKPGVFGKWLKITGIFLALMALGGIIAGLVIELR